MGTASISLCFLTEQMPRDQLPAAPAVLTSLLWTVPLELRAKMKPFPLHCFCKGVRWTVFLQWERDMTSLQWERKLRQWILATVLRPCASWPEVWQRKSLLAHSPLRIPHPPPLQWTKGKFSVSEAKASTTPSRLTTVEGGGL